MGAKLYVGNLPFQTSESELREVFEKHGSIVSVKIVIDRATGRSRGFGFIEFEDGDCAQTALGALDGQEFGGRALRVNEANEKRSGAGATKR